MRVGVTESFLQPIELHNVTSNRTRNLTSGSVLRGEFLGATDNDRNVVGAAVRERIV